MNQKAITEVRDAKMRYESAVKANMGVQLRRTELINFLLNNMDDLLAAAQEGEDTMREYNLLVQENMKLNQQLAELKAGKTGADTKKTKG